MVKRKKSSEGQENTKVVAIILGLLAAAFIIFFVINKAQHQPAQEAVVDENKPKERIQLQKQKPTKPIGVVHHRVIAKQLNHPVLGGRSKIAIIIDDWGQSTANCRYLDEIKEPIAVSILPGLRHTKDVANCARLSHQLTMLHLPLEALHNHDLYPPNYIIKTTMPAHLVASILEYDLDQLPSIEGVNNHMGSKATESNYLMGIILRRLKQRGLFFVDSMTARNTVCEAIADDLDLEFGKRDVFLDNVNTREAIIKQIVSLAQKSRRRGYAVAIGHDRRLTMQVLKEEIPILKNQGFEFVSIKSLLKNK